MITRRTFAKAMALSPLTLPGVTSALAQAKYPSKPIQMVVGFPPGQTSDISARMTAKQMTEILKQTVYIENKPGAATIIGHQYLKAAAPDGYTIAYSSTGRSRSTRRSTRSCLTIRRPISSRSSCSALRRCSS